MRDRRLATWVPDERPKEVAVALDGDYWFFAAISPEDRANGRRFKRTRANCGITLGAAAWLLGLTVVELAECERGARRFDYEEAMALLREDPRDHHDD